MRTPIIIAGSGRSGTTWILDVLAEANGLRTIFEPLHPQAVSGAKYYADRFIDRDVEDEVLRQFMDRVFAGELKNWWTNYRVRQDLLVPSFRDLSGFNKAKIFLDRYRQAYVSYNRYRHNSSGRIMVKFIRANLMMGWLEKNYACRSALVVRHPGAVVASKLRLGWPFEQSLARHTGDHALIEKYLYNYMTFLEKSLSPLEAHTAIWCIQNVIPLLEFNGSAKPVIFYERLVEGGVSEWAELVKQLGLEKSPSYGSVEKPSQQACRKEIDKNSLRAWQKHFTSTQLDKIQSVLDVFGVTVYKARESMPTSSIQNPV